MRTRGAWAVAAALLAACATPVQQVERAPMEARLQRAEDELAIRRLLIDYATHLDGRDYAAYVGLFTPDGEWTNSAGSRQGRDAIRAMLEGLFGPAGTPNTSSYHLMSNPRVDLDGDRATATSRYLVVARGEGGRPTPSSAGIYRDELMRLDAAWKIKRRTVEDVMPTPEEWARIRAARAAKQ